MTNSLLASPMGLQIPRIRCVPEYTSSVGREAVELAALAGLHLDPWEQLVLIDGLGRRPDRKWAAFEVGVVVPRQNGKGAILEARELAGLFLLGEDLIIHSAHEQATSSEHFRRLLNLIEGVPEFDRRVLKAPKGKGAESIELRGGQRILFKTRTGGGGRGLTGDLVVLDEAMILPLATTAALVPTMAARSIMGNPQLWYTGSAVDQQEHEHGVVLASVRERGMAGVAGLMYVEWSADAEDPDHVTDEMRTDPQTWARANPGMSIRISEEHIAKECGGALGRRQFAVERLGVGDWPDTSEDSGRKIGRAIWAAAACHDESQRIVERKTFALDMDWERTSAAIGVAGKRSDDRWHIAVVESERGTDWLVDGCVAVQGKHPRARFVIDKRGPAASLIPDLKAKKVRLIEVDANEYADACAGFFDGVTNDHVRYPAPQPELDDALTGAATAPLGEAWKWSRKNSTSASVAPLVACTLALWGAQTRKSGRAGVVNLAEALQREQDAQQETPSP